MNLTDAVIASQSDAIRNIAGFALGKYWGVVIRKAADAGEASRMLDERAPQLMIVDSKMSDVDGLVVSANRRGVRTIALNWDGSKASAATHRLPEPFQPSALQAVIDSVS